MAAAGEVVGLGSTYEGLKPGLAPRLVGLLRGLGSTYEGLKPNGLPHPRDAPCCLGSTYEGLKHYLPRIKNNREPLEFGLYL